MPDPVIEVRFPPALPSVSKAGIDRERLLYCTSSISALQLTTFLLLTVGWDSLAAFLYWFVGCAGLPVVPLSAISDSPVCFEDFFLPLCDNSLEDQAHP